MERLARTANEIKRKHLSTYFGILYHPLFTGIIGVFLGIYIQFLYQSEDVDNFKKECIQEQFFLKDANKRIKIERNIYRMKLDRNGYPVEEMIKRESNEY